MVDRNPEQQRDLLDLIGDFGPNREKDGRSDIIEGVRLIFSGSGLVVPTLDQLPSSEGKTAEITAARQAPVTITKETPQMAEWRRQTDRFIELGFGEELKFSDPEAYRLTIPKFPTPPKTYVGRYDKPLAVEQRIPLPRLHQLVGIKEYIDTSKITNLRRIPQKPYTVYIANTVETVTGTFDSAMGQLAKDGVASPFIEVDMAYLRYLELFQTWLDAADSRFGADRVPDLAVGHGRPGVDASWVDDPGRHWRVLSRGKKIGT